MPLRISGFIRVSLLAAALSPAASANLIINHSFESKDVTHPDNFEFYFAGSNAITGWTIIGHSVDLLSAPRWIAQDGLQSVDLTGIQDGGIFQDVATTAGETYRLSFWLSGNPEFAGQSGNSFVKTMRLSWDGALAQTINFDVTGKTNTDLGWTQYSFDFVAFDASARVQFEGFNGGFAGPLLDNVSLIQLPPPPQPVPLPAAVFAGAVGAFHVLLRSRRR